MRRLRSFVYASNWTVGLFFAYTFLYLLISDLYNEKTAPFILLHTVPTLILAVTSISTAIYLRKTERYEDPSNLSERNQQKTKSTKPKKAKQ